MTTPLPQTQEPESRFPTVKCSRCRKHVATFGCISPKCPVARDDSDQIEAALWASQMERTL